jgi:hypothetical protein
MFEAMRGNAVGPGTCPLSRSGDLFEVLSSDSS